MKKQYRRIAKTALVFVYLVIIAGAVVRMTGSGMGCPDWPKCFGYYIPPTDASELEWHSGRTYNKGQVIIIDKTLRVAKSKFTTTAAYNENNWEQYTKHDYAIFNAAHTWTEYINRLFGALAGFATLFLAIASFGFWKTNRKVTLLSWLVVFSMGFQAWLGATVVYSVLLPAKITIHMIMALVIVALILYLIAITKEEKPKLKKDKTFYILIVIALLLTLVQVVLGTKIREYVDHQVDLVGYGAKDLWLDNPTIQFYIHRSLSVLVFVLNAFLFYRNRKLGLGFIKINWVMVLIGLEILTGIAMYYFDFPFLSQPLHLVIASILFGVQFYLFLQSKRSSVTIQTL